MKKFDSTIKTTLLGAILSILCMAQTNHGTETAPSTETAYLLSQENQSNSHQQPTNFTTHTTFALCSCPSRVSRYEMVELTAYGGLALFGAGGFSVSLLTQSEIGIVPGLFLYFVGTIGVANYFFDRFCIVETEPVAQTSASPDSDSEEI